MRARPLLAAFLLVSAAFSVAQKPSAKIKLIFEKPAPRIVWAGTPDSEPSEKATKTSNAALDFSADALASDATLIVLDEETGNLAVKRVGDIGPEWKVTDEDFQRIGQAEFHIESKGKPVAAANVVIRDGKGSTRTELLDASNKGVLFFRGLAPGNINVKVTFKIDGKEQDPYSVSFPVGLERRQMTPILTVALPDGVGTVDEGLSQKRPDQDRGKRESSGSGGESERPAPRSGGADILTLLVMLAILGGLGWFVYRWIKANPAQLQSTLKKMGVEIPEPQQAGDPNPPPAAPEPAGPPPQILLGDATPEPLGAAPIGSHGGSPSTSAGAPRLVGDAGLVLNIKEGTAMLGRDDGLPFSFPIENTISRKHAEIERSGGRVLLRELGSTNGTFVNGGRVDGEVELKPGDRVQFGSVKFRFEV